MHVHVAGRLCLCVYVIVRLAMAYDMYSVGSMPGTIIICKWMNQLYIMIYSVIKGAIARFSAHAPEDG